MPKCTLLIHGPFVGHALGEIFAEFQKWPLHTKVEVVLVVYTDDRKKTEEYLRKQSDIPKYRMIEVKDLINPGFFNINRQIVTVRAGLEAIQSDRFVIKLRNDQWVDFSALQKELEKRDWLTEEREKLVTTNCFTRKDRLYHPSDMFLCAWQPTLAKYYSAPLMNETHIGVESGILEKISNGIPFQKAFICPEIYLCKNYLNLMGWELKYTERDSFRAIQRYFRIINSWEIGLRWKKARTPYKGEGAIILPQYWNWPPFPGMKDEEISCYLRSDFEGKYTEEDKKYYQESIEVWKRYENELRGNGGNGGQEQVNRKKELLKRAWHIVKRILHMVALLLPVWIVLLIRKAWHTKTCENMKDNVKRIIKRIIE